MWISNPCDAFFFQKRRMKILTFSTLFYPNFLDSELLIVENEDWHRIRGAQMVVVMISIGFDLDQGLIPSLPAVWQYAGYLFHPGSVIFGPWISFREYNTLLKLKKNKLVMITCLPSVITIDKHKLKGNMPRISSYTWLFAKNTG